MNYWQKLISKSDDASHKRLIACLSFMVLIAMVVIKAFGWQVDKDLIYVFAGLCGGQSVLTVISTLIKPTSDA